MGTPSPAPLPPNATPEQRAERDDEYRDIEAFAILATIIAVLIPAGFVVAALFIAGGVKLVAQVACVAGLVAIAMVYAYRYIRARV